VLAQRRNRFPWRAVGGGEYAKAESHVLISKVN
jgi:hypothetical protein